MTCPLYALQTIQQSSNPLNNDRSLLDPLSMSPFFPPSSLTHTRCPSRGSYLYCSGVLSTESGWRLPECETDVLYMHICVCMYIQYAVFLFFLDTEAILGYLSAAGASFVPGRLKAVRKGRPSRIPFSLTSSSVQGPTSPGTMEGDTYCFWSVVILVYLCWSLQVLRSGVYKAGLHSSYPILFHSDDDLRWS